jgi:hypothetical protein
MEIFMNLKKIPKLPLAMILIVLLTVCGLFYFNFSQVEKLEEQNANHFSATTPNAGTKQDDHLPEISIKKIINNSDFTNTHDDIDQPQTIVGTPADSEILRRWEEKRGRFNEYEIGDYATYDLETLQKLVSSGDMKAMTVLAQLYLSDQYVEKYGLTYALPLFKLAAIYGSSDALGAYAIGYRSLYHSSTAKPIERPHLLESLAWENTAALRGDILPNNAAKSTLEHMQITLTEQEKTWIQKRSIEIYDELSRERKALGMTDFNNDVPSEVQKFFSQINNYMSDVGHQ